MKQFVRSVFLFIPFMVIVFGVLLFVSKQFCITDYFHLNLNYNLGGYGHMYSRMKEVKTTKNVDILFLGSSHTYRGFDTRIFKAAGFSSFNLGSSSQTPAQTKLLLARYLQNLNPKLVVYEVFPDNFIGDGVESSVDIISNDRNDFGSFLMTAEISNVKTLNTFIYSVIAEIFGLNSIEEEAVKENDIYVSGGFVEKKISFFSHKKYNNNEWKLKDDQVRKFEEIIRIFKAKNINYVLVYAPVTRAFYESYTNTSAIDSIMSSYGKYCNFNKNLNLDDSLYFYDEHHLNQNGVTVFNNKLIETLKADGYLIMN